MTARSFALPCLIMALMLGSARGEEAAPGWQAGVATIVITPDKPVWMSGYAARTKPAQGKLQDIKAKALVLADPAGQRAVIVTMDLVGIPRDFSVAVCEQLQTKHDLPREAILLSTSHTHSGPVVGMNLRPTYSLDETQQQLIRDYTTGLKGKLLEVVEAAFADLAPATLSSGNGYATFAVNRRNNAEKSVPSLRKLGKLVGPVDHDVPVLAVRATDGTLRAVLFGYACHATVLSEYDWSGDYPGFAQSAIEEAHPGATALFFAGCGGDQNPVPRRVTELAKKYGDELGAAVNSVLAAPMKAIGGTLATSYSEIPLEFAGLPSKSQLQADAAGGDRYQSARAKLLLAQLEDEGALRGDYPYPVQAWRLGDGPTLIALGGEVVVDYSLRLKAELGRDTTWVAGYTNDVMAYIPSLRVLTEGGYEGGGAMVYYGLPGPWSPKVEEAVIAAAHEQAGKVRDER